MINNISKSFFFSIKQFVLQAGIEEPFNLISINNGKNNRAWMLKTEHERFFLKHYFFSEYDKRDRFGNETLFSRFAWEQGIRNIPELLSSDRNKLLGLFNYIEGRQPGKNEINKNFLQSALNFVKDLNRNKTRRKSQLLPKASEACFCLADHLETVRRRITQLKNIDTAHGDNIDREVEQFIIKVLEPEWQNINSKIKKKITMQGIEPLKRINRNEMLISPSDFGFHNAILSKDNKLFFVDFEYAGWDDPVKLICDFFCQPEIPVSLDYFDWFTKKIIDISLNESIKETEFVNLALFLLPLHRIKWCCIMLNDFISVNKDRRNFSSYNLDTRKIQLSRAVNYLKESCFE